MSFLPTSSVPVPVVPVSAPASSETPHAGGNFDSHAFNVGLNEFMDYTSEAVKEFDNHVEMRRVANQIVSRLLTHHDVPLSDARHPFNKFATPSLTDFENKRRLAHIIMADFAHAPSTRAYVVSFFHSGGCNREWMDELFDEFLEWVDDSTDTSDPDSNSSLAQSPTQSPSVPPLVPPPMPTYLPMLLHSSLAEHVDETAETAVV